MRYDTIIIGGGLSGLTAGITLAKAGQKVCIVSAGQSSLHFILAHSTSWGTMLTVKLLPIRCKLLLI